MGRAGPDGLVLWAGIGMSDESLNLGEALRLAREKANRERNRAKCKRYYRRRVEKENGGDP